MTVSLLDLDVTESVEEAPSEEQDHWCCAGCYPLTIYTPGKVTAFCGKEVAPDHDTSRAPNCEMCEVLAATGICPKCGMTW